MKKTMHKIHLYLSLVFLPMMLGFAITGMLVMLGVDEDSTANISKYTIKGQIPLDKLESTLLEYIKTNNIAMPDMSKTHCIKDGVSFGGISYCVGLMPYQDSYEILVINRDIIGSMIMLHNAKGEVYFTAFAFIFGISIVIIYFSGLFFTSFCAKRRKEALLAVGIGAIAMIFLGYISV